MFCSGGFFDYDNALIRLDELASLTSDPTLWDKPEKAQKLMSEKTNLENAVQNYEAMNKDLQDNLEIAALDEADDNLQNEILQNLQCNIKELNITLYKKELHIWT